MSTLSLIYFICLVGLSACQSCKTRGEWCADTYQCCGGCCIQNVCIDTYDDCHFMEDPCLDEYCPEDAICRLYKPGCEGCDVERRCIFLNPLNNVQISMDPGYKSSAGLFIRCTKNIVLFFALLVLNSFS